jgi:hypothetical protein
MFIQKMLVANNIVRDYLADGPDLDINENPNSFENQYVVLTVPIERLLWLADKKWKWPKNDKNPQLLPEKLWMEERSALLAYGKNLKIATKAALCGTFHNYGTSYLIWLEFTGPDNIQHKIDIYINEKSSTGERYATKVIDGVPCEYIYKSIIGAGIIVPRIAKKLNSIGSVTWDDSTEGKVQYKLNSFIQQKLFEKTAEDCPFVELRQLDPYDDYLYKGDPGRLADYDLTIIRKDGTKVTARVDLKLLHKLDFDIIEKQNRHDAEIIIATALLDADHIKGKRVFNLEVVDKIENTKEFEEFMLLFKKTLKETPPQYIKINYIDTETGKVTYNFFN